MMGMEEGQITQEKLMSYLRLTHQALQVVVRADKDRERLSEAEDVLDLSQRYYHDALHFKQQGKLVMAFTAVNYAHAFLDVGARLGLFKVHDSRLFMVDDKTSEKEKKF